MAHLLTSMILVLGVLALLMGLFSNFSADGMATSLLLLGLGFLLLLFILGGMCPPVRDGASSRRPRSTGQRLWRWITALPQQRWAALALAVMVVPASYLVFYSPASESARGGGVITAPSASDGWAPAEHTPSAREARAPAAQPFEPELVLRTTARLASLGDSMAASMESTRVHNAAVLAPLTTGPEEAVQEVLADAVEAWRAAWASKDVDRYLGAYAPSFQSVDGRDFSQWKAFRRERLGRAQTISIQIESLSVAHGDQENEVHTRFVQHYHAGSVKDSVQKTLRWRRLEQGWRIVREESQPI